MTDNPYQPPANADVAGDGQIDRPGTCPNCGRAIRFGEIAFAASPLRLSCRGCHATLIGGLFVHLQLVAVILFVLLIFATALMLWALSESVLLVLLMTVAILVPLLILFTGLNVLATMKWGRYRLR